MKKFFLLVRTGRLVGGGGERRRGGWDGERQGEEDNAGQLHSDLLVVFCFLALRPGMIG